MKNLGYQMEVKVWINFEIPAEDLIRHNINEKIEDILSIDKAEENGLDIWEYFDEDHWSGMSHSSMEQTGEEWEESKEEDVIEDFNDLLSDPDIMNDNELMSKIIDLLAEYKGEKK